MQIFKVVIRSFFVPDKICAKDKDCDEECDTQTKSCVKMSPDKISNYKMSPGDKTSNRDKDVSFVKASKVFSSPVKEKLLSILSHGDGDKQSFEDVKRVIDHEYR